MELRVKLNRVYYVKGSHSYMSCDSLMPFLVFNWHAGLIDRLMLYIQVAWKMVSS